MFKNVLLPIKFDCFVRWVVGVGVLTWGERCTPEGGIHGEGVPPDL